MTQTIFSPGHRADPEALRAVLNRDWIPEAADAITKMPGEVETAQWARDLHFWISECVKLGSLDRDGLVEMLRAWRSTPTGPAEEAALMEALQSLGETLQMHCAVIVEVLGRLETAQAIIQSEADRMPLWAAGKIGG